MDTLNLTLAATLGEVGAPVAPTAVDQHDDAADLTRWRDLVAQIGAEIAAPLTAALERVTTLTATGRIDRAGLRSLRHEIELARNAGMICQQLSRLAAGRVAQSHERVHLTHTLQSVLAHRTRELQARGSQVRQTLQPVEVIADAPLLFGLLNALLDWASACAHGPIELIIDTKPWPAYGRLVCRFPHRPLDEAAGIATPPPSAELDNIVWRLLEHTAHAVGLTQKRETEGAYVRLTLEFPRTINPLLDAAAVPATLERDFSDSVNSKPLAGSHVLVVSARRDTRTQVREAVKHMGLVLDFVGSVEEAFEFCQDGLPNAIVIETVLKGAHFKQLASEIRGEVPDFVFIEIDEQGADFQISSISQTGHARVSRNAIMSALPSALVYELTRAM